MKKRSHKYLAIAVVVGLLGLLGAKEAQPYLWSVNKTSEIGFINDVNPRIVLWGTSKTIPILVVKQINDSTVVEIPKSGLIDEKHNVDLADFEAILRAMSNLKEDSFASLTR